MPSAGNAEWVQSYKFQPLYRIFWISTLMSEMTFHRARSPERKNFLHLRLLTAARVDLQEFFHMLMWKTEPSLTPRSRSVICGLEGGRGKNTCICISIKKQVRMTQVISYNRSSSQQENWNSEYLVCTEVLRLPQVSLEMQQPGWKIIHIVLKN